MRRIPAGYNIKRSKRLSECLELVPESTQQVIGRPAVHFLPWVRARCNMQLDHDSFNRIPVFAPQSLRYVRPDFSHHTEGPCCHGVVVPQFLTSFLPQADTVLTDAKWTILLCRDDGCRVVVDCLFLQFIYTVISGSWLIWLPITVQCEHGQRAVYVTNT